MTVIKAGLTLDEFLKLPEKKPALEYADGEVTQKVSPQADHSRLQESFARAINNFAESRRLAIAFTELRTTFAGASRVPDVAVYRWDRIPLDEAGRIRGRMTEPPDIAIEIISPEQTVASQVRRCLWFVANGVALALLLNPDDDTVRLFRPGEEPVTLEAQERVDFGDVLPGFAPTVQEIFASLYFH
jgi:Uma2 family endonuclease